MNMNGYEHSMKMDETAKNGRTLKDLNLTDDFLFDITTENLENCKYIIELSLGIELKALRWKENQKVIHNIPGKRGIRMILLLNRYPESYLMLKCRNGMKEIFRKEQGFIRH